MYFYLLLIPALIILIITIVELGKISKHDKMLYPFCQLRRNILSLLGREGLDMSNEDYALTNHLLEMTDVTIHEFNRFKIEIFNLREVKIILLKSHNLNSSKDLFANTENKKIAKIQEQFKYCLVKATLAYTPFLRSRIILHIMLTISKLLFKMSVKRAKNFTVYLRRYEDQYHWFNSTQDKQNLYLGI